MNAAGFSIPDSYYEHIKRLLKNAKNDDELFETIVNAPFHDKKVVVPLGLGHTVLALVNKQDHTLDRIALSRTESAQGAVDFSVKPFRAINIPLSETKNIMVTAIETGKWYQTDDWQYTFTPVLTPEEARFNQAGAGTGSTVVYPLKARDGGVFSFSYFKPLWEIGEEQHIFMRKLTDMADAALSGYI